MGIRFVIIIFICAIYSNTLAYIESNILYSWKENCPLHYKELKFLSIKYLNFQNEDAIGYLIIKRSHSKEVIQIFKELYEIGFLIEKINPVDKYNGDDILSMNDNNTSAFNCRAITGKNKVFSKHSYGIAIDINPIQNPYIKKDIVLPLEGKAYLDRKKIKKGMINDKVVKIFKKYGWQWGGDWSSLKDYQHFEKTLE